MINKEELYNNFVKDFSLRLSPIVKNKKYDYLIFLCIGTDKLTGDSFGPLVGYKLNTLYEEEKRIKVIGGLDDIVCAVNIDKKVKLINEKYSNSFIISIDSAMSNLFNIGSLVVERDGLYVGSALNKNVLKIGDFSIKGIVTKNMKSSKYNFRLLQNTSLSMVMAMADVTAKGIYDVIKF